MKGKNIQTLIADGLKKIGSAPSGAPAAKAEPKAKEAPKPKEAPKKKEAPKPAEDEDEDMGLGGGLFD